MEFYTYQNWLPLGTLIQSSGLRLMNLGAVYLLIVSDLSRRRSSFRIFFRFCRLCDSNCRLKTAGPEETVVTHTTTPGQNDDTQGDLQRVLAMGPGDLLRSTLGTALRIV